MIAMVAMATMTIVMVDEDDDSDDDYAYYDKRDDCNHDGSGAAAGAR